MFSLNSLRHQGLDGACLDIVSHPLDDLLYRLLEGLKESGQRGHVFRRLATHWSASLEENALGVFSLCMQDELLLLRDYLYSFLDLLLDTVLLK